MTTRWKLTYLFTPTVVVLGLLGWMLLTSGCTTMQAPTLEQSFWAARAAFNETQAGYNRLLTFDNAQLLQCYTAHKTLLAAQQKLKCPPVVSMERRAQALEIIHEAQTDMTELDMALQLNPTDAQFVSEGLGRLESLSFQLVLMYQSQQGAH